MWIQYLPYATEVILAWTTANLLREMSFLCKSVKSRAIIQLASDLFFTAALIAAFIAGGLNR